ncbi:unnamed protein product [Notodromas monacha]|uniref:Transcription termination/antitermination protein NusG n=1 Tax=Notodromas monacha TaxID=399045 RepID=A0A7R9C4P6_9CRUS|nr:unnamed protein product [Notodromas monacha]CAG0926231.1 unnamed protein product [Notodromas monacha]
MNWYVIKVISGQENKIKMYIENEMHRFGLSQHLGQIAIPMEKVVQVRDGKKIVKDKVHYPGYVMIETDLQGEVPHIIKNIIGVIGFLSETKGGDPVPMRQSEINRMLGKVTELSNSVEMAQIPYKVGESIKVVDGPFNGFNGVIDSINEEKRKLQVMVLIFGRKTPLELNYMQVSKIV